jgi:hypothetical protein
VHGSARPPRKRRSAPPSSGNTAGPPSLHPSCRQPRATLFIPSPTTRDRAPSSQKPRAPQPSSAMEPPFSPASSRLIPVRDPPPPRQSTTCLSPSSSQSLRQRLRWNRTPHAILTREPPRLDFIHAPTIPASLAPDGVPCPLTSMAPQCSPMLQGRHARNPCDGEANPEIFATIPPASFCSLQSRRLRVLSFGLDWSVPPCSHSPLPRPSHPSSPLDLCSKETSPPPPPTPLSPQDPTRWALIPVAIHRIGRAHCATATKIASRI